mmetsp:Transcript_93982/g.214987  ORF Transcript_93982/g.214987 Transcript_93982/m.214987 type:complete len:279 (-) Transcript_93982:41-877(-)
MCCSRTTGTGDMSLSLVSSAASFFTYRTTRAMYSPSTSSRHKEKVLTQAAVRNEQHVVCNTRTDTNTNRETTAMSRLLLRRNCVNTTDFHSRPKNSTAPTATAVPISSACIRGLPATPVRAGSSGYFRNTRSDSLTGVPNWLARTWTEAKPNTATTTTITISKADVVLANRLAARTITAASRKLPSRSMRSPRSARKARSDFRILVTRTTRQDRAAVTPTLSFKSTTVPTSATTTTMSKMLKLSLRNWRPVIQIRSTNSTQNQIIQTVSTVAMVSRKS